MAESKAKSHSAKVGDPVLYTLADGPNAGQERLALVTRVHDDGTVNLTVLADAADSGRGAQLVHVAERADYSEHLTPQRWSALGASKPPEEEESKGKRGKAQ